MSTLAIRTRSSARRNPWLAVCGLLILAGMFFLPSLHHLADHDHHSAAGSDCATCLLLNLSFLALPCAIVLLLVADSVALAFTPASIFPAAAILQVPGARAPPLSN